MKRFLALILAIATALVFVSCHNQNKAEESKTPTAAEKKAAEGVIPEMKYPLGTDPDDIIAYYENYIDANEGTDEYIDKTEGELTVRLSTIDAAYYYEKGKEDKGVSMLINFSDSYGYRLGITMPEDIKADFAAAPVEMQATDEQMHFFPAPEENCKILQYHFGKYRLEFYFVDDFLSATALTDTENWTD